MDKQNERQYELVAQSHDDLEYGLRARSITGDICTRLLRDFLAKEIKMNFNSGVVNLGNTKKDPETKEISPQCDIIVYRKQPRYKNYDYVVAPRGNVAAIIEVKKSISEKQVRGINKQINRFRKEIRKPIFLVAFIHDGEKERIIKQSQADGTFLFSKNPHIDYADNIPDFKEKYLHRGELEKLVSKIKKLV